MHAQLMRNAQCTIHSSRLEFKKIKGFEFLRSSSSMLSRPRDLGPQGGLGFGMERVDEEGCRSSTD